MPEAKEPTEEQLKKIQIYINEQISSGEEVSVEKVAKILEGKEDEL